MRETCLKIGAKHVVITITGKIKERHKMGLSANQAKLLSITARLSDNELRSQFITNSKLRLADSQTEATTEYMRALDKHDLMYSYYDADSLKTSMKLTPGALMEYGELKNQYGIVDNAGRLMVSSVDKANFEKSTTLEEFLDCYGITKKEDGAYQELLKSIYGDQWFNYHSESDKMANYNYIYDNTIGKHIKGQIANPTGEVDPVTGRELWAGIGPTGRNDFELAVQDLQTSMVGYTGQGGLVGSLSSSIEAARDQYLVPYMTEMNGVMTLDGSKIEAAKKANENFDPFDAYNNAVNDAYKTYYTAAYGGYKENVSYKMGRGLENEDVDAQGRLLGSDGQPVPIVTILPPDSISDNSVQGRFRVAVAEYLEKIGVYDDSFDALADMPDWINGGVDMGNGAMENWLETLKGIPGADGVDLQALFGDPFSFLGMPDISGMGSLDTLQQLPLYDPPPEFNEEEFAIWFAENNTVNATPITPSTTNCWFGTRVSGPGSYNGTIGFGGMTGGGSDHIRHHFSALLHGSTPNAAGGTNGLIDIFGLGGTYATSTAYNSGYDDTLARVAAAMSNPYKTAEQEASLRALTNELSKVYLNVNSDAGSALANTTFAAVGISAARAQEIVDYHNQVKGTSNTVNDITTDQFYAAWASVWYEDLGEAVFQAQYDQAYTEAFELAKTGKETEIRIAKETYDKNYQDQLNAILGDNKDIITGNNNKLTGNNNAALDYLAKFGDDSEFRERMNEFDDAIDARISYYDDYIDRMADATGNIQELLAEVSEYGMVPENRDPKVQWYTNLWYRMGGTSETTKDGYVGQQEPGTLRGTHHYVQMDDKQMNNSAWLQWALETGTITMEQVVFTEKGSDEHPNLKEHEWKAIGYTNSSDINSQQNSRDLTRAEVKYEQRLRDIQAQDKKFDNDLKKLDSQHSALQQEYESLKAITDKNIERSFKAFS